MTSGTDFSINRRAFLRTTAGGLGFLALSHLLGQEGYAAAPAQLLHPLAPRLPHHRPRAKAVICLFQHGGPSHVDLFDPKPELTRLNGTAYSGPDLEIHVTKAAGKLLGSPFKFKKSGQCGMELSELLPRTAGIADRITLVRSM